MANSLECLLSASTEQLREWCGPGEAAADAVRDGDTGEARLQRYMDKCHEAGLYRSTLSWSPRLVSLEGHSDAEIEAMIPDMLVHNEIHYGDVWDF